MSAPRVSAIIIFKDGLPFIEEAVESVLAQTYSSLELIMVDDGSVDGSGAVAEAYARRQPELTRLVRHPKGRNRGMSASRNLGVRHARGTYIAFLDADDVWLRSKTAEQVAILDAHPNVGLLYGRTQIWHSWSIEAGVPEDFFFDLGVEPEKVYAPPALLANLIENRYQTPTTCNAMIRRETYEALGGFEDSFRGMYEDQVFWAKLYLNWETCVSDRYWARYRQHPGNQEQGSSRVRYLRQRKDFLRFVRGYARPYWESLDDRTRKVLDRQLWFAEHPYLDLIGRKVSGWTRTVLRSGYTSIIVQ